MSAERKRAYESQCQGSTLTPGREVLPYVAHTQRSLVDFDIFLNQTLKDFLPGLREMHPRSGAFSVDCSRKG